MSLYPPSPSPSRSLAYVAIMFGLFGLGIVILALCTSLAFSAFGAVIFGQIMSEKEDVILHTVASPDGRITALVIGDDCGATCRCNVRVDLKTNDRLIEEAWRGVDVCDAIVTWQSTTMLDILDDNGQRTQLDMRVLGLAP